MIKACPQNLSGLVAPQKVFRRAVEVRLGITVFGIVAAVGFSKEPGEAGEDGVELIDVCIVAFAALAAIFSLELGEAQCVEVVCG